MVSRQWCHLSNVAVSEYGLVHLQKAIGHFFLCTRRHLKEQPGPAAGECRDSYGSLWSCGVKKRRTPTSWDAPVSSRKVSRGILFRTKAGVRQVLICFLKARPRVGVGRASVEGTALETGGVRLNWWVWGICLTPFRKEKKEEWWGKAAQ